MDGTKKDARGPFHVDVHGQREVPTEEVELLDADGRGTGNLALINKADFDATKHKRPEKPRRRPRTV